MTPKVLTPMLDSVHFAVVCNDFQQFMALEEDFVAQMTNSTLSTPASHLVISGVLTLDQAQDICEFHDFRLFETNANLFHAAMGLVVLLFVRAHTQTKDEAAESDFLWKVGKIVFKIKKPLRHVGNQIGESLFHFEIVSRSSESRRFFKDCKNSLGKEKHPGHSFETRREAGVSGPGGSRPVVARRRDNRSCSDIEFQRNTFTWSLGGQACRIGKDSIQGDE